MRLSKRPEAAGAAVLLLEDLLDGLHVLVLDGETVTSPVTSFCSAERTFYLHRVFLPELCIELSGAGQAATIVIVSATSVLTATSFFLLLLFPLNGNDTEIFGDIL